MFCPNCGAQNEDNAAVCQSCGQPLGTQNAAPAAAPQQSGGAGRSTTNILAICASVLFGLGAVMPFARIANMPPLNISLSAALTDWSDWVFVLAVAAVGLVCALLNKNLGVIIAGGLGAVIVVYEMIQFSSKLGDAAASFVVTKGIGFYALVIGTLALLVVGVLERATQKKG